MNNILLLGMPGGGELIFIVLVIIMLFGSKKIPELARGLGKGMREIKNVTNDIQQAIREGARQVNNAKDFTNVEKQVEGLIKEEKTSKKPADNSESIDQNPEESIIKPLENSNSVQRENPYQAEQKNTSEEA